MVSRVRFKRASALVPLSLLAAGLVGVLPGPFGPDPADANGGAPDTSATAITAGQRHTCALTGNGGVKCWGWNPSGALGDGTTTEKLTPVDVVGLDSDVTAITGGSAHTCALTSAGGVKCWGYNGYGQLGDGTTRERLTPVDVVGLASGVTAITAGEFHTCALIAGGSVKCWGYNRWRQLGDGSTRDRLTPVRVVGLHSRVAAISAGEGNSCALTSAGGVKCWGYNVNGQLGDGTTRERSTPVRVVGLDDEVRAITTGDWHTCALTSAGGVKCWGYGRNGQLGHGYPFRSKPTPARVVGLHGGATAVTAGAHHTCAVTPGGGVKCWGWNADGQLGNGTTNWSEPVTDVVGLNSGMTVITAGTYHSCALTTGGGVKCWGAGTTGQLGDDLGKNSLTPVDAIGLAGS